MAQDATAIEGKTLWRQVAVINALAAALVKESG
uniref:Uncharacterized protein n=1 Tax=Erwinia amylovora ATCC BAA-2158 TaxID=889211 RepID=E5B454_ERWAM|nr:hypothetical protein predicted by Glimmer/Critica [Erwinia amylovora ATCC BAA-2158]